MRPAATGILLKLGSTLSFTMMYAAIKLAGDIPVGETIFFRSFFALIPLAILSVVMTGKLPSLRTAHPGLHLARSAAGLLSMFMNFAAVLLLPLADLTAFGFAMPIFAVVLAALLLREKVGRYRWAAVLTGFAGVLVMLSPHGGLTAILGHGFSGGALLALGGALFAAVVVVIIRRMHGTERGDTIILYFMLAGSAAGAITMIWDRASLSAMALFWLVTTGLLGGLGQIGMTFSYRFAEPSLLAPFDYTGMVWSVALGYLIFAEVPEPLVMAGAAIVIAAGLFIVWREARLKRVTVTRTAPAL